jgi:integrase
MVMTSQIVRFPVERVAPSLLPSSGRARSGSAQPQPAEQPPVVQSDARPLLTTVPGARRAGPRVPGQGRRADGQGSVYPDGKGWRVCLGTPTGPVKFMAKTEAEAKMRLAEQIRQRDIRWPRLRRGHTTAVLPGTLSAALDGYISSLERSNRGMTPNTLTSYRQELACVLDLPLCTAENEDPTKIDQDLALAAILLRRGYGGRDKLVRSGLLQRKPRLGALTAPELTQAHITDIASVYATQSTWLYNTAKRTAHENDAPPTPEPRSGHPQKLTWLLCQLHRYALGRDPRDNTGPVPAQRPRIKKLPLKPLVKVQFIPALVAGCLDVIRTDPVHASAAGLILFILLTGCRLGEALAFTIDQFDRVNRTLDIRNNRVRNRDGGGVDNEASCKSFDRTDIPFQNSVADLVDLMWSHHHALEAERARCISEAEDLLKRRWSKSRRLFVSKFGTSLEPNVVANLFRILMAKASQQVGTPQPIKCTLKDLRKAWAVAAKRAGVPDVEAAQQQGHSLETHLRVYLAGYMDVSSRARKQRDRMGFFSKSSKDDLAQLSRERGPQNPPGSKR